MENGHDLKDIRARTSKAKTPVVVEDRPRHTALENEMEQRKWRRRNNISSLHGLIREHSRLIGAIHTGRIELTKGEVLSRAYGRHREMVTALEQRNQLAEIQQQLAALNGEPASVPRLPSDLASEAQP